MPPALLVPPDLKVSMDSVVLWVSPDSVESVVSPVCLDKLVSLESRDLSELLVSAVPPDLLDPLDWLVLLERLAVRDQLVTMVPLVATE